MELIFYSDNFFPYGTREITFTWIFSSILGALVFRYSFICHNIPLSFLLFRLFFVETPILFNLFINCHCLIYHLLYTMILFVYNKPRDLGFQVLIEIIKYYFFQSPHHSDQMFIECESSFFWFILKSLHILFIIYFTHLHFTRIIYSYSVFLIHFYFPLDKWFYLAPFFLFFF